MTVEVLHIKDWLQNKQKQLYCLVYIHGTELAERVKDKECFYLGEDVFRYGTIFRISGWHRDRDVIKLSGYGNEFYTSINTISKVEEF